MTGAGMPREIGAGTPRDGSAEPECSGEAERSYDLDAAFRELLAGSSTLRKAHERRRRQTPGLTIHFEIDPELDAKRRKAGLPESGGGTTTGSCGDVHRAIIIDPLSICEKGDRTLTEVLLHELGHVLKCQPDMTPEAEHKVASDFATEVEVEIYSRGRRDPFEPPPEVRKRRSGLDRIRNALSVVSVVLGLFTAIVRFIERLVRRGNVILVVSALARPELLIEIEAIAVLRSPWPSIHRNLGE